MCGDGLSFTSIEAWPWPAVTPWQAVFVNDPSFQTPSCGGASSWLVKEWKRGNPVMQFALLLLLFGVAHTLFTLWRSYSRRRLCRFASYSQKFIHILGDLGVGVKLASSLLCQWMRRTASRRPFSVLPIDSSVQVQGAPLWSCKGRTAV